MMSLSRLKKASRALLLTTLLVGFIPPSTVHAVEPSVPTSRQSASEVISQINGYRAQNGLYAYTINDYLMRSAQVQSDYQASIGTVTHTGSGGSTPKDRAYDAGYGEGEIIWVSEIIYGGMGAFVDSAMTWWKNSTVHNSQMLSSQYLEVGAGISSSGGRTYFTVVMGYVTGGTSGTSDEGTTSQGGNSAPAIPFNPVVVAEPGEDGSIVHIVQAGQTLWTIAAVYDIDLDEMLELNDLTSNSLLQPGQEITIRTAQKTATPPEPTLEPTPTTTAVPPTFTPTTPDPTVTSSTEEDDSPSSTENSDQSQTSNNTEGEANPIGAIAVGMIVFYAIILLLGGSLRNVREKNEPGS